LGAIPILAIKFGSIGYPLRRRCGIGGLRGGPRGHRGVGGEIPLSSFFGPHTFRSEAAANIENRREVVIRYGPLALSGQPMIAQYWGPVLIASGHGVPSFAIMGHVASVCYQGTPRTRGQRSYDNQSYSKTLVLWPSTRKARAGSQSTIHPMQLSHSWASLGGS
jgi:hypothetical protein